MLLRTGDGGRTWTQVAAPPFTGSTPESPIGAGVAVRFATPEDGWAFQPSPMGSGFEHLGAIFETTDGGMHWSQAPVVNPPNELGIDDLETAGDRVQVVFTASPISIETGTVGANDWSLSPATLPLGAGPVPSEQLVLQGATGWILENDRIVIGGARLTAGSWRTWTPPCADAGGAADLTAADALHLAALCDEGAWSGGPERLVLALSNDGGTSFVAETGALPSGVVVPGPLASPSAGVVFATSPAGEILATFDSGATWTTVYAGRSQERDFLQLGFTSPTQGLAIEAGGTMLMTYDGGHSWTPVSFPEVRP